MRTKKLLNVSEGLVESELIKLADNHKARVFVKPRVADVLAIDNSGISRDLYSYALKAHVDFVITNEETEPLFAVEFDGPTHEEPVAVARDKKKNELCVLLDLPLMRINQQYLIRTIDTMLPIRFLVET